MKPISLQITYRKGEPFAAYIYLAPQPGQKSERTEEFGPEMLVDYGPDGAPVGIEIVSPDSISAEELYAVFERLGLDRPAAAELAPLRAA